MTSSCQLVALLLLVTSLAVCHGTSSISCGAGPPGKYCTDDLSGYHDCHVDPKTGQMMDTTHECSNGTRCVCFVGRSCPGSVQDPCEKFRSPPDFPHTYRAYGETRTQIIGPTGPGPVSFRQTAIFQKLDEKKFRWNRNHRNFFESWFYLPTAQAQIYNEYYVRWDKEFCNKTTVKTFPRFGVPSYFTYNGTVKFDWRVCEEWVWHTGGRHAGDPRTSEYWYIYQAPSDLHYEPYRYEYRYYGTPMSKTDVVSNTSYVFLQDVLDSEFDPPKQYCSLSEFESI